MVKWISLSVALLTVAEPINDVSEDLLYLNDNYFNSHYPDMPLKDDIHFIMNSRGWFLCFCPDEYLILRHLP